MKGAKLDKTHTRTPSELERKYKLDQDYDSLQNAAANATSTANRALTAAADSQARLAVHMSDGSVHMTAADREELNETLDSILARLDAIEGVRVAVAVAAAVLSSGTLTVAGEIITGEETMLTIKGGSAEVVFTLTEDLDATVIVNEEAIGTVAATDDSVNTTVAVVRGTVITVTLEEG